MNISQLGKPIGRPEKFKYAIATGDTSRVPLAISREEKWLKAIIDGRKSNLPIALSPVEKYMKSVVTGYVDDLPKPISNKEKWWYAIATGLTTNLPMWINPVDKFDYYLAKNAAVLQYNRYVSYNVVAPTSRKGITKSLAVAGTTVYNAVTSKQPILHDGTLTEYATHYTVAKSPTTSICKLSMLFNKPNVLKPNTVYTYIINTNDAANNRYFVYDTLNGVLISTASGANRVKFTTPASFGELRLYLENRIDNTCNYYKDFVVLEGDHLTTGHATNLSGISSVGTVGKNLFDKTAPFYAQYNGPSDKPVLYDAVNDLIITDGVTGMIHSMSQVLVLKPNTKYSLSFKSVGTKHRICVKDNGDIVREMGQTAVNGSMVFTTVTGIITMSMLREAAVEPLYGLKDFQIEEGEVATSYEPYKLRVAVQSRGKNLLNPDLFVSNYTKDGITISFNKEMGTITLNGTLQLKTDLYFTNNIGSQDFKPLIVPRGRNYVSSIKVISGSASERPFIVARDDTRWINLSTSPVIDFGIINYIRIVPSAGTVFNNYTISIQVEEGSTATPYQDYQAPHNIEWPLSAPLRGLPNAKYNEFNKTLVQQSDSAIKYTGTWNVENSAIYNGGTGVYSNSEGASASYKFVGTSIKFISVRNNNLGIMEVLIDGVSTAMVDLYSPTLTNNMVVFEAHNLAYAEHTIVVRRTGRKNPASIETFAIVDAFEISSTVTSGVDTIDENGLETRRVGVYTFTGKELASVWTPSAHADKYSWFKITLPVSIKSHTNGNIDTHILCDKLPVLSQLKIAAIDGEGISQYDNYVTVRVLKQKASTANDILNWLRANHVTILYELAVPVTKQLEKKNIPTQGNGCTIETTGDIKGLIDALVPING